MSAVDGPITLGDFGQPHQDGACDHEGQCVLLAIWADVGDHMRQHLDGYTLADVAARPGASCPGPAARRPAHRASRLTAGQSARTVAEAGQDLGQVGGQGGVEGQRLRR